MGGSIKLRSYLVNQLSVPEWWYNRTGIITRNGISDCIKNTPLRNEIRYGTLARWKSGFERFTEGALLKNLFLASKKI